MNAESTWEGYVADAWARFERGEIGRELDRLVRAHFERPPDDVLDVGTGPGVFLAEIHRAYPGAVLTGIDLAADHVAIAARDLAARGVVADLFRASGAELPFADEQFDLVVCQMVMPYALDDRAFLVELARVLRPGGVLWFATHGFGFYVVRIGTRALREKLRYMASVAAGAASVTLGWKPFGDTPVSPRWVVRTLGELGFDLLGEEQRGRHPWLPEFVVASARKRGSTPRRG